MTGDVTISLHIPYAREPHTRGVALVPEQDLVLGSWPSLYSSCLVTCYPVADSIQFMSCPSHLCPLHAVQCPAHTKRLMNASCVKEGTAECRQLGSQEP